MSWPKTSLIRVDEEAADAINQAASERRLTVVDLIDSHLMMPTEKAHRDYIKAESRRLDGGS